MKQRISVSIDIELIPRMRTLIRTERILKNKSQVVEFALKDMLQKRRLHETHYQHFN